MNVQEAIYTVLTGDATLTAMLSSSTAIFNEVAPQDTPNPCIVFTESGNTFNATKTGVSTLDEPDLQVDVYADTAIVRNQIAAMVRTVLDRYSGTVGTIKIQQIDFVGYFNIYDDLAESFRCSQDYSIRQVI